MSEMAEPHPPVPLDQQDPEMAEPTIGREASLWRDAGRQLMRNPTFLIAMALILIFLIMAIFPQWFAPNGVGRGACQPRLSEQAPGELLFGRDEQGCPYYERVIYGVRPSMIIGPVVTIFAFIIAMIFGTLSGYFGKYLDTAITRVTDIIFALPLILGALVILTTFRNVSSTDPDLSPPLRALARMFEVTEDFFNVRGIGLLMFTLVILGWPTMLRLARSSVLATKGEDYVDAARAMGASDWRIMLRHIIPNSLAPVLVYFTITIGTVIVGEAALSFLGVGLTRPAISWGLQLNIAQTRINSAPHMLLFPGAFLAVLVFSFILLGDAVRDALDPKLR